MALRLGAPRRWGGKKASRTIWSRALSAISSFAHHGPADSKESRMLHHLPAAAGGSSAENSFLAKP
jgi:hypothetical protein